jgi:hypothetical protein
MDEEHTNNTLLIERYLQGKLSAEEAAEFEEHFLSSDDLLDELESAERLQQGLKDVATLEKAHAPAKGKLSEKLASNIVSLFQSPRYAMAASFLLLVSLGFSSFLFQQNVQLSEIGPGLAVPTEIIPMVSVRGITSDEPINTLHLGDSAQQFVLMLDPGYGDYTHLRATVFRMDSSGEPVQLWQLDHMLSGFEDMLALSLPGSILSPGDFEIHLEGWREEWPANHIFEPVRTIYFTCIGK